MTVQDRIAAHPVPAFLAVAFAWTWAWDGLFFAFGWWKSAVVVAPRQWGLPIAAVLVLWAGDGKVRSWGKRVLALPRPVLLVGAVLVPLAITNGQPAVRALGGGTLRYDPPGSLAAMVLFVLANAVLLGGTEEFGWRGYLQPRLQSRLSVTSTSLVVGGLWWLWHLPLFFAPSVGYSLSPVPLATYTTFVLGAALVLGALVNAAEGSVLPAVAMHACINLGPVLAGTGGWLAGAEWLPLLVGSGAWWLIALVLFARYGRSMAPQRVTA